MCVRRDYSVWLHRGKNVIVHSCLGNNVPNQQLRMTACQFEFVILLADEKGALAAE
jgi:hypothetical protein